MPAPTAFHTATLLGPNLVLLAGGHLIGADGNVSFTPPASPLTVLEVESASRVVGRPIDAPGVVSTMFHTATPVDGFGVLLAGGARVDASENRLVPTTQVGVVESFGYRALAPLRFARFGHTATALSGRRVLVVGGLGPTSDGPALAALRTPELFFRDAAPATLAAGECTMDLSDDPDASVSRVDAALPPVPDGGVPPVTDAGPSDAALDGGTDAGFDGG